MLCVSGEHSICCDWEQHDSWGQRSAGERQTLPMGYCGRSVRICTWISMFCMRQTLCWQVLINHVPANHKCIKRFWNRFVFIYIYIFLSQWRISPIVILSSWGTCWFAHTCTTWKTSRVTCTMKTTGHSAYSRWQGKSQCFPTKYHRKRDCAIDFIAYEMFCLHQQTDPG